MSGNADKRHLDAFLEMMLAERGASLNTIEAYRRDVRQYLVFLSLSGVDSVTAGVEHVRSFVEQLSDSGLAARTQARKLSAIRQFQRFLMLEGARDNDPTSTIDAPRLGRPQTPAHAEAWRTARATAFAGMRTASSSLVVASTCR